MAGLPRGRAAFYRRLVCPDTHADFCAAEFRGPGTHHHFDDSPDDFDNDMEQRTRFIGGKGRVILLGDGTEIQVGGMGDDDGDVDMEDRGAVEEAENEDLDQQVQSDAAASDAKVNGETADREETPAPKDKDSTVEAVNALNETSTDLNAASDSAEASLVAQVESKDKTT